MKTRKTTSHNISVHYIKYKWRSQYWTTRNNSIGEVINECSITDCHDPLIDSQSQNVKLVLGDIFHHKALDANFAVVDVDSIDEERKSLNNEDFDESSIDSGLQFKEGRQGYDLNIQ